MENKAHALAAGTFVLVVAALMWLSVRFGPAPSVPMAVLISVIGCIVTVRDRGPFSKIDDGLVYLQASNATLIFYVELLPDAQ